MGAGLAGSDFFGIIVVVGNGATGFKEGRSAGLVLVVALELRRTVIGACFEAVRRT